MQHWIIKTSTVYLLFSLVELTVFSFIINGWWISLIHIFYFFYIYFQYSNSSRQKKKKKRKHFHGNLYATRKMRRRSLVHISPRKNADQSRFICRTRLPRWNAKNRSLASPLLCEGADVSYKVCTNIQLFFKQVSQLLVIFQSDWRYRAIQRTIRGEWFFIPWCLKKWDEKLFSQPSVWMVVL